MKLNYGCIYKITNLINNKIYIGQTIRTLKIRWKQHLYRKGCTYLHSAILKYGKENFKIENIETVETSKLDEREIYWIDFYKSTDKNIGYNLIKGGRLGQKDKFKLSKEQIQHLVEMEREGISHIQIGKFFNINRKTVTFILKREIEYDNKRVSLEERKDLNLMLAYMQGNNPTMQMVCTKFKIGRNTLIYFSDSIGYKFPSWLDRKNN